MRYRSGLSSLSRSLSPRCCNYLLFALPCTFLLSLPFFLLAATRLNWHDRSTEITLYHHGLRPGLSTLICLRLLLSRLLSRGIVLGLGLRVFSPIVSVSDLRTRFHKLYEVVEVRLPVLVERDSRSLLDPLISQVERQPTNALCHRVSAVDITRILKL